MSETPATAGVSALRAGRLATLVPVRGHAVVTADGRARGVELLTVAESQRCCGSLTRGGTWPPEEGPIPAVRLGGEGGPVRFERAAMRAYLADCRTAPPPRGAYTIVKSVDVASRP